MTDREASDSEILAAVERWARARGFYREQHAHGSHEGLWLFGWLREAEYQVHGGMGEAFVIWDRNGERFDVDAHTALLVALLIEGGITVDLGKCPACKGSGSTAPGPLSWDALTSDNPLSWENVVGDDCPDCNGTSRDIREAARLVLDAAPKPRSPLDKMFARVSNHPDRWEQPGDTRAREHLHVKADDIQGGVARCVGFDSNESYERAEQRGREYASSRGGTNIEVSAKLPHTDGHPWHVTLTWTEPDPLGEWLSLWLAGSRVGTADAVDSLHTIGWRHEVQVGDEPSRRGVLRSSATGVR